MNADEDRLRSTRAALCFAAACTQISIHNHLYPCPSVFIRGSHAKTKNGAVLV